MCNPAHFTLTHARSEFASAQISYGFDINQANRSKDKSFYGYVPDDHR